MTIALIDDDEAVLDSLRMLLHNRGWAVECFTSAGDFLARFESMALTCIVSDVRMPGLSGLDLQQELVNRRNSVPLILITGHGDIAMAVAAVKAGAFDFIEKPLDDDALMESIGRASDGAEQHQKVQARVAEIATRAAGLSPRQRQVMELVARGLSNKEIALQLGISPRTVDNYRAWVMEKMEAATLADLVRMVVQLEFSKAAMRE
jgi:two-component system, LuxR family, response regulator FixJ